MPRGQATAFRLGLEKRRADEVLEWRTFAAAHESAFAQVFGRRHDGLSTRRGGRRPKSAKARNRGGWGTRRCGGRYGDLGG